MKKVLVVLFALLISAFAFAEKVQFEFWHAMSDDLGKTLNQLIDNFNKENPDIQVKGIYVGNYGALNQKLLSTITAYNQGTKDGLPVMAQAYGNWTAKFLFSDVVEELNDYIFKDAQMRKVWTDEIYPVFKDMSTWGSQIYSVPFNKSVYTYYYNTDLFDMKGVKPPKTIDEFIAVSKKLTDDVNGDGKNDQFGIGIRTTVDDFQTFLYAYKGSVMRYAGSIKVKDLNKGKYTITLDKATTLKALELAYNLKKQGIGFFQGGYFNDQFGAGLIAAYMGTIAGKTFAESSSKGKHGWSWSPLPSVSGTPYSPIAGTDVIMFSWASKAQKDAAWRFMKYLLDPVNQAYWAIRTGYVPVRKDVNKVPQWQAAVKADKKLVVAQKSLDTAVADPKPAAWEEIRKQLGTIFTNFLNDKIDANTAYEQMYKAAEKLLKESGELYTK